MKNHDASLFLFGSLHSAKHYGAEPHKQKTTSLCGWIPERPKGADCKSVAIASKVRILLRPVKNEDKQMLVLFYYRKTNDNSIINKKSLSINLKKSIAF